MPLNFAQTLQRRKPVEVADPERFVLELANLGVSVRLTLHWQNKDYWVLVRQRRQDRGDVVLKLISGYVPAHSLLRAGGRKAQVAQVFGRQFLSQPLSMYRYLIFWGEVNSKAT